MTYDEYGYLDGKTITDLEKKQREMFVKFMRDNNDEVEFVDFAFYQKSDSKKKTNLGEVEFKLSNEGVWLNEAHYTFDEIHNISMQGKRRIIIYLKNGERYLLTFDLDISTYKYVMLYKYLMQGGKDNDSIELHKLGL